MKLMLLIYNILIIHVLTYKYQLRGMREIESAKEDINISYSEIKYLNNIQQLRGMREIESAKEDINISYSEIEYLNNIQQLYDMNFYKNSFYILLSKNKDLENKDQL